MSSAITALTPSPQPVPQKRELGDGSDVPEYAFNDLWQDRTEGLTFGDVLDVINPLQHIPVVSTIYRMATGDEIGVGSRLLGGALFGGPLGVLAGGFTAVVENLSGGSVETHVASLWHTLTDGGEPPTQLATATPVAGKEKLAAATFPPTNEDDATADEMLAAAAADSRLAAMSVTTSASVPNAVSPARDTVPFVPQPLPRPPVTVSPLASVHRVHSRHPNPVTADRNEENERIAKAVEQAQRAQAGLLLASLGIEPEAAGQVNERGSAIAAQPQPFRAHPYLLPRGAPPQLVSRAMEYALAKYQATIQQRNGSDAAFAPAPQRMQVQ